MDISWARKEAKPAGNIMLCADWIPGRIERGLLMRLCQTKHRNPGTRKAYETTSKDRTKGNRLVAMLGQKLAIFL